MDINGRCRVIAVLEGLEPANLKGRVKEEPSSKTVEVEKQAPQVAPVKERPKTLAESEPKLNENFERLKKEGVFIDFTKTDEYIGVEKSVEYIQQIKGQSFAKNRFENGIYLGKHGADHISHYIASPVKQIALKNIEKVLTTMKFVKPMDDYKKRPEIVSVYKYEIALSYKDLNEYFEIILKDHNTMGLMLYDLIPRK